MCDLSLRTMSYVPPFLGTPMCRHRTRTPLDSRMYTWTRPRAYLSRKHTPTLDAVYLSFYFSSNVYSSNVFLQMCFCKTLRHVSPPALSLFRGQEIILWTIGERRKGFHWGPRSAMLLIVFSRSCISLGYTGTHRQRHTDTPTPHPCPHTHARAHTHTHTHTHNGVLLGNRKE